MSSQYFEAAWVPSRARGQARLRALDEAVGWLREAADTEIEAMFFRPAGDDWDAPTAAVAAFADETADRMKAYSRYGSHDDGRAVLAFVDSYTGLSLAQGAASASYRSDKIGAIVFVPAEGLRGMQGWARSCEALDLSTGRTALNSFPASQVELLTSLVDGLRDSSHGMGRDRLDESLRLLRERTDFDPEMVQGFAMAEGATHKRLDQLASLLWPVPPPSQGASRRRG